LKFEEAKAETAKAVGKARSKEEKERRRREYEETFPYVRSLAGKKFLEQVSPGNREARPYLMVCNVMLKEAWERLAYPIVQLRGVKAPGLDGTCGWLIGSRDDRALVRLASPGHVGKVVAVKRDVAKEDLQLVPLPCAFPPVDTTCGVCLEDPRGLEAGERPLRTFCCGKHICEACAKKFEVANPVLAALCPYCRSSTVPDTQFDVFLRGFDDVWQKGDAHAAYILGCGFHPYEVLPFHEGYLAHSAPRAKVFLGLAAALGHRPAIQAYTQYSWLGTFPTAAGGVPTEETPLEAAAPSAVKAQAADIYRALLTDADADARTKKYATKQLTMIHTGAFFQPPPS